jgi:hypothetical protein
VGSNEQNPFSNLAKAKKFSLTHPPKLGLVSFSATHQSMLQLATASSTPLEAHRKLFIRLCAFARSITCFATVLVTPKNSKCMGTIMCTSSQTPQVHVAGNGQHS